MSSPSTPFEAFMKTLLRKRQGLVPDQRCIVTRQILLPVVSNIPLRRQRIVQIHDVPHFICVHIVKARERSHAHGVFPVGEVFGEIHAIPLLYLAHLAQSRIANGIGAVLGA